MTPCQRCGRTDEHKTCVLFGVYPTNAHENPAAAGEHRAFCDREHMLHVSHDAGFIVEYQVWNGETLVTNTVEGDVFPTEQTAYEAAKKALGM